jgi:hypothetical protein
MLGCVLLPRELDNALTNPLDRLKAFLSFARTYRERSAEIVEEAVGGGESWYVQLRDSAHLRRGEADPPAPSALAGILSRSLRYT